MVLPIESIVPQVVAELQESNTLVVTADPGAGKSTVLPLRLMQSGAVQGKILMLEPRRIAARAVAERMAELQGESCGQSVGYRIRFEQKVGNDTRIEVLTEGILTNMIQNSQDLEGVGCVIFDEFHERSLNADLSLALCREVQQILRPDLKIIIMSATIDTDFLTTSLSCKAIHAQGKCFDVKLEYMPDYQCSAMMSSADVAKTTAMAVQEIMRRKDGSALVFLPGEAEIKTCADILNQHFALTPTVSVLPLYGAMPIKEQMRAIRPSGENGRKVVLATPIAETSLTIEGVTIVVDSGLHRVLKFNPNSSLQHLQTEQIQLDMAAQRAGRAGRTAPGVCYRLYNKGIEAQMDSVRQAEIETQDLTSLRLAVAKWGSADVYSLPWLTPPPRAAIANATMLLKSLNAIDDKGSITPRGVQLAKMPCHPRIGEMLLTANGAAEQMLACDIAALLDERDILRDAESVDITLRVNAFRRNRKRYARTEAVAQQYRQLMGLKGCDDTDAIPSLCGMLLASAFPDRIASSANGKGAYLMVNGANANVDMVDDIHFEQWIVVVNMNAAGANGGRGRVFLAAPVNPTDLKRYVVTARRVFFDEDIERVVAEQQTKIGCLVLGRKQLNDLQPDEVTACLTATLRERGSNFLELDDPKVLNLRARVITYAKYSGEELPFGFDDEALMDHLEEWLVPFLSGVRSLRDVRQIDLAAALTAALPYGVQVQLGQMVPERVQVPSGNNIRLKYNLKGEQPILEVRLQECFGMTQTPAIMGGKVPVLMHLLSPGFKLVQITQNMAGFWTGAYLEIKKELKNRYPKHKWL